MMACTCFINGPTCRDCADHMREKITTIERDLAQSRAESADRLRVIEEVAAVIGFKYPSECRDFLAKRVREKIEACETAGRVLAKECERNRYFREVEVQHAQVCGEVFREWIEASKNTDANEKALAWVKAAQEAST